MAPARPLPPVPTPAVALLEIHSLGAALVVLDQVEKAAHVQVLQAELNDNYGLLLKFTGTSAAARIAVERAAETARSMRSALTARVLDAPDREAWGVIESPPEFQPLLGQGVVLIPRSAPTLMNDSSHAPAAIGLIETQGFTAVTMATDAACKAASVEVIAKEKLGGGYVTVIFEGDIAAVEVAVAAGRRAAEEAGKLISAQVLARPSPGVARILTHL
jgi:carbon dioxide concentrating mechanism protein CcmO